MGLNGEGDLRGYGVTVKGVAVADHDAERGGGGSGEVEEAGNPCLDEVMGTSSIHEDDDTVVANGTVEAECLWGGRAFHGVEAYLGNEGMIRVVVGEGVRGEDVFVHDEHVKT